MEKKTRLFQLVVACDTEGGIGKEGKVPWHLPTDMANFKSVTLTTSSDKKRNAVIMGRKTWEGIPARFRPLKGRLNIVISTTLDEAGEGVQVVPNFEAAVHCTCEEADIESVFVIGGNQVYTEALTKWGALCKRVHLSLIQNKYECDAFFPLQELEKLTAMGKYTKTVKSAVEEKEVKYSMLTYEKTNKEEQQYIDMIQDIMENGNSKGDRTGTGTLSVFGRQMRFSLRSGVLPLLTTKRVFWKGVAEELFWFIKGDTNAKHLQEKKIHIWDGNSSREFLDKMGFTERAEGDLGPIYGFQWRHFGADYSDCNADYTGQGIDQLKNVIETIKKNPNDRRIIMSAWNPAAMSKMALPPCHILAQFYVFNGELSCMLYQRSCDMGLGVPFNIASYALLTRLIAKVTNLNAAEFIHTLGDTHVYNNHVDPLKEQIVRVPVAFPTLVINRDSDNIEDYCFEDLQVFDYTPMKSIKMEMAV